MRLARPLYPIVGGVIIGVYLLVPISFLTLTVRSAVSTEVAGTVAKVVAR
jgi:hypothetical protein